ncbi:MAG: hypothetical protein ACD_4C00031G0003 [uncultured bacterium (gcode 4)]|uniref:Uncharacterized protein n=1 Tax=uncultured bacterium (gcode 4) TaxID=1234023 RepID=K2GV02_9BACT|nr:MAG: hypothetical protein ACD_4C00031G0003 [uncultured bacterium (gcode 4)]
MYNLASLAKIHSTMNPLDIDMIEGLIEQWFTIKKAILRTVLDFHAILTNPAISSWISKNDWYSKWKILVRSGNDFEKWLELLEKRQGNC